MTEVQDELRAWSEEWRSNGASRALDAAAISREVRRRTRRHLLSAACELVVLITMLAALGAFGVWSGDPWDLAMVLAFSLLIAVVFLRRVVALRHTWRAETQTTGAFVELMVVRGEASMKQIQFGWLILVVEIAVFIPWIGHTMRSASPSNIVASYLFLAAVVTIAAATLVLLKRRARRELARWRALRDETRDGPIDSA